MTATKIWRPSSRGFVPAKPYTSKCARSSYASKHAPGPRHSSSCRLSDHPISGVLLERLRRHGRRRPLRPDDTVSRRSSAQECPQLSLHPHPSRRHCALTAQRRHHASQGLRPLWLTCVHEEKTPSRTTCEVNSAAELAPHTWGLGGKIRYRVLYTSC